MINTQLTVFFKWTPPQRCKPSWNCLCVGFSFFYRPVLDMRSELKDSARTCAFALSSGGHFDEISIRFLLNSYKMPHQLQSAWWVIVFWIRCFEFSKNNISITEIIWPTSREYQNNIRPRFEVSMAFITDFEIISQLYPKLYHIISIAARFGVMLLFRWMPRSGSRIEESLPQVFFHWLAPDLGWGSSWVRKKRVCVDESRRSERY